MAVSSPSMSLASTTLSNRCHSSSSIKSNVVSPTNIISCSRGTSYEEERNSKRRTLLLGSGALALSLLSSSPLLAEEIPKNYDSFVDLTDGYSYYYPSDWREFDFRGHDSAFKDRYLQLQNLRLSFIPTNKSDIHDLGPLDEVVYHLVNHVYSAPTQFPTVYDMQEELISMGSELKRGKITILSSINLLLQTSLEQLLQR